MNMTLAAGVLLTLAVHATVLLALAWVLERLRMLRDPELAETAWRAALLAPLCAAALAVAAAMLPAVPAPSATDVPPPTATTVSRAAVSTDHITAVGTHAVLQPAMAAAAAERRPLQLELPSVAMSALLAAWIACALFAAWQLRGHWRQLRRLRQRAAATARPPSPLLLRRAERIAARLDVRVPQLALIDDLPGPMVVAAGRVLLPVWSEQLPPAQQDALLAHEFSHLRRRDLPARALHRLALLPLAWHPLARLAVARLDALAESACDRAAARVLGDGRPLAECLAACVARHGAHAMPSLALAMAARPGPVVARVQSLLQEFPMSRQTSPLFRRSLLAAALCSALLLPAFAVAELQSNVESRSIQILDDGEGRTSMSASISGDDWELEAEIEGRIDFNADESDVVAMNDDAEFEIEETRDGVTRSIEFSGDGTDITREYRIDGRAAPFDDAARAWLATVIPSLYRVGGLDAERRSKRILERAGVPGLLQEIALLHSDYPRRMYLATLFQQKLSPADLQRALALATAIDSDFELRTTLGYALESQTFASEQQLAILQAATRIESDFERAELLTMAIPQIALDGPAFAGWQGALDGISSDFETGRVLQALIDNGLPATRAAELALDAIDGIGSDFERRSVLLKTAAAALASPALTMAYLRSTTEMSSDFERRTALIGLIGAGTIDAPTTVGILAATDGMSSDFEIRTVLVELANAMPDDAGLLERYRDVARRLGNFERGIAEQALDRFAVN